MPGREVTLDDGTIILLDGSAGSWEAMCLAHHPPRLGWVARFDSRTWRAIYAYTERDTAPADDTGWAGIEVFRQPRGLGNPRETTMKGAVEVLVAERVRRDHIRRQRAAERPGRVYVATSWRNPDQPGVVGVLRADGHRVYDFRNPSDDGPATAAPRAGFGWEQIHADWEQWTTAEYLAALHHPLAVEGFAADMAAMEWADRFVLVMPCGRSAHLEAGWAIGRGKPTAILLRDRAEPELMYRMADLITDDMTELRDWARQ